MYSLNYSPTDDDSRSLFNGRILGVFKTLKEVKAAISRNENNSGTVLTYEKEKDATLVHVTDCDDEGEVIEEFGFYVIQKWKVD